MSIDPEPNLPERAPVMVLPNALLFRNSLLPLHIFENRYRQMLGWCLEQHRMFCIALMKPGIDEAAQPGDFFHVAGLGLIRACVGQNDGTSNLVLQGLARVKLAEFVQREPFWVAEIRSLPSRMPNQVEADALSAKVLEICKQLQEKGLELPPALESHLPHLTNPDVLADVVSNAFVGDALQRQQLLEEVSVSKRLRLLIRFLEPQVC